MTYDILRFLHVIGATVLLGTGAGIAFHGHLQSLRRSAVDCPCRWHRRVG